MTIEQPASPAPPMTRAISRGEFHTAMVHLYRGEVGRANTWRARLDGTTNWAVLTTAATLSFAFASASNTHVMILINTLLVFFFMFIEARRYRFYDLWRARVRLIEVEFFADMLAPQASEEEVATWRALLADDLLHPRFSITIWQALARRLRRNYVWLFLVAQLCVAVSGAVFELGGEGAAAPRARRQHGRSARAGRYRAAASLVCAGVWGLLPLFSVLDHVL